MRPRSLHHRLPTTETLLEPIQAIFTTMPHILTRALPRASVPITSYLSGASTRLLSYAPNPQRNRKNPNQASKLPQTKRPLARPTIGAPTITEEALKECKWVVRRTSFAQLPVYRKWRQGATKQEIMIKKATGDKILLVDELKKELKVADDRIKINPTTGAIVLTVRQQDEGGPKHNTDNARGRTSTKH